LSVSCFPQTSDSSTMSPVHFCLTTLLLGLAWVSGISARPLARDNSTMPDRLVFA
jgi:hypothetical protein